MLTRERLDAMIARYYEARGLDPSGLLTDAQIEDLRLGARPVISHTTAGHQEVEAHGHLDTRTNRDPHRQPDDRRAGGDRPEGTTIWQAAKDAGIDIPVLCHDERYDPVGVCRMCVVDVGARVLRRLVRAPVRGRDGGQDRDARARAQPRRSSPSCCSSTSRLSTRTPRRRRRPTTSCSCSCAATASQQEERRFRAARGRGEDHSNPVIAVNHDACILCDRCVRACDDIQGNDVIGRSGKGYETRIAFDLDDPMGESSCVTCGECVAACPTGALTNKPINNVPIRPREELRQVDTVCPYCGVGCALTFNVDDERQAIAYADGRAAAGLAQPPVREGPLRLGLLVLRAAAGHAADPARVELSEGPAELRRARRGAAAARKKPGGLVDYDEVMPHFREATWEEALDLAATRLKEIHAESGPGAIAGSARRSAPTRRPTSSRS